MIIITSTEESEPTPWRKFYPQHELYVPFSLASYSLDELAEPVVVSLPSTSDVLKICPNKVSVLTSNIY